MVAAWVESEFHTLDLGDKRRDRRVKIVVDQFAQVAESTPDACRGIAALEATYRIANNSAVSAGDILKAHHQATIARTVGHACVILAQDTTAIEADIFELFLETRDMAENHHFIVRGCQGRALAGSTEREDESSERSTTSRHIDDALAAAEIRYEATIEVSGRESLIAGETCPRRKSREARAAKIEIRAATVTLRGPRRPGGKLDDVTISVVEVREVDPPVGEDPIRWTLLTSLPIGTIEEIKRVVQIYCRRWLVELFFKTLKSGCRVEKLKYEHIDSYLTAMSMLIVVAWRIEYLKCAAREDPDASCEKYFSMSQWVPVYLVHHKAKKTPSTPPTISEFMLIVAKLGGYINRKGQGPPGSMTVWRGMQRMETLIDAYSAFGEAEKRCVV